MRTHGMGYIGGNISYRHVATHLPYLRFLDHVCVSLVAVVELCEVLQQVLQRSRGGLANQLHTEAAWSVDVCDVDSHHLAGRGSLPGVRRGHGTGRSGRL